MANLFDTSTSTESSTDIDVETPTASASSANQNPQESLEKRKQMAYRAGAVTGVLAAVYLVGALVFSSHFTPGTTVNGLDASGLTAQQLADRINDEAQSFSTHVTGDGLDFTVSAQDITMKADGEALAKNALESTSAFAWPVALLDHPTITSEVGVTYNQDQLTQIVNDKVAAFNETATPPTNATATFDKETSTYTIVPMKLGTQIDSEAALKAAEHGVKSLSPTTKLGEAQLKVANISDDNPKLAEAAEKATSIAALSIPMTHDGKTVTTINGDLITKWIDIREAEDGGVEVYVNKDAVHDWSYETLNGVVNGENETTSWEVDSWGVADALAPKLTSVDGTALEVPTVTTAIRPEESEGHETRGRHIDINLTTQYARLYDEDGKTVLWRSPFVSGDVSWGHETPEGDYQINFMEEGTVLTGLNNGVVLEPGEEPQEGDYYNSYVDYWMAFIDNAVGLHDATWRSDDEFGGDTYMYNGSHGCVNLPYDAAEQLYGLVHVGDRVYVHY